MTQPRQPIGPITLTALFIIILIIISFLFVSSRGAPPRHHPLILVNGPVLVSYFIVIPLTRPLLTGGRSTSLQYCPTVVGVEIQSIQL